MKRVHLKQQTFLCAAAGILLGTIFCNQVFFSGLVNYTVLYGFLERGWNHAAAAEQGFVFDVLSVRLAETAAIFMLAKCRLRSSLIFFYTLWMGVCASAVLTILTWSRGFLGFPYFLACIFPHMFFYTVLWGLLALHCRMSYGIRRGRFWSVIAALAAAGICSEIFLNSRILGLLIGFRANL